MKYEVGENITICDYSHNAPPDARGETGMVIDVTGSVGMIPESYTVDTPEHGTLYLTVDDIKPLDIKEDEHGNLCEV
tara:strand:+ start:835 stop:1065 length:231 start_codon:yes stop_codon:yes gene_type:complete